MRKVVFKGVILVGGFMLLVFGQDGGKICALKLLATSVFECVCAHMTAILLYNDVGPESG